MLSPVEAYGRIDSTLGRHYCTNCTRGGGLPILEFTRKNLFIQNYALSMGQLAAETKLQQHLPSVVCDRPLRDGVKINSN